MSRYAGTLYPRDQAPFTDRSETRLGVFDYVEGWYNPHRRHLAISYYSPMT